MASTVLSAVDQAARNVRDGQVGDTSAVPGLAGHVESARSHARTWLDTTRQGAEKPLRASQLFVSGYLRDTAKRLTELTPRAESGDHAAATEFVNLLQTAKTSLGDLQRRVAASISDIGTLNHAFTSDAALFAADLTSISEIVATDQRMAEELGHQAQALRDKIDEARRWENVGWILGPIGWGIARIWGDNIADVNGLERRISELQKESGDKNRQAADVSALTARLTALTHSVSLTVNAMTALDNSLTVVSNQLTNVLTSVTGTSPSYKGFVTALLDTVAANCRDLGDQLTALLGAPAQENAA